MALPLRITLFAAAVPVLLLLNGCSPTFDWREVRGEQAPYLILMPAKPASSTRDISLDGMPVSMTMTVARVDDISFSVGSGKLPQPAATDAALQAMKTSLLRNTNAVVRTESTSTTVDGVKMMTLEGTFSIGAAPPPNKANEGGNTLLAARFAARNGYVYQVVAFGPEKALAGQVLDTFLTSFRPG
jgi:hypothetical protein